jgi:hypothetical protein
VRATAPRLGSQPLGARYVDAYVAVVRERAAEGIRDVEAATAAYRDAMTLDVDNVAAREALARFGGWWDLDVIVEESHRLSLS